VFQNVFYEFQKVCFEKKNIWNMLLKSVKSSL